MYCLTRNYWRRPPVSPSSFYRAARQAFGRKPESQGTRELRVNSKIRCSTACWLWPEHLHHASDTSCWCLLLAILLGQQPTVFFSALGLLLSVRVGSGVVWGHVQHPLGTVQEAVVEKFWWLQRVLIMGVYCTVGDPRTSCLRGRKTRPGILEGPKR